MRIDEHLAALRREGELLAARPYSLHVGATDIDRDWLVRIGSDRVHTGTAPAGEQRSAADCAVLAPAAELYPLLWNRRDPTGLDVHGDPDVLALWRSRAIVYWA